MTYEKLSKGALKCMYIATGLGSVILMSIALVLNKLIFIPENMKSARLIVLIMVGLILANAIISPYFRFHRYRYCINEECIDIKEGYIFVKRAIVPIERLHKLEMQKGPIDRMCGVAKLIVTTAGGDVTLRFVDDVKVEQIADFLKKRINQIVIEQRDEDGKE